ncbi:NAD(P)/FAD-dependent oxidoreductase [Mesorhizobium sp. M4A.F.Ca.ET.029.04.2.1]|nr:NAD(P)/FAD-dependent oxidoreductase [Mesorhizobium sp. M4A.F.Ca.ET.029.04.2.1]
MRFDNKTKHWGASKGSMSKVFDAIVIGAGNNGLACACYLAKAGLKVLVLERRHVVGGAALSEEIVPGFTFSVFSYVAAQLHPKVVNDLELKKYGLQSIKADYRVFRPVDQKRSMMVGGDVGQMQAMLSRFSHADAARYPEFRSHLSGVSEFVHDLKLQTPVDIVATSLSSRLKTANFLWGHRNVGGDFYKLIDLFTQSSDEYLSRWFESSEVKAVFAFAVGGSLIGPKTHGSAWLALHGGSTGRAEKDAISGQVVGGMGSITKAMARCAEEHGVEILTNCDVTQIQTRNGRVNSVVTSRGEEYVARTVVGNLNAKVLFSKLVAEKDLPSDFISEIARFKTNGAAFKLNIACERAPQFSSFKKQDTGMESPPIVQIAPDMGYLEHAYEEAKPGWYSSRPSMIMTIPTVLEPSLAPKGKHIVQIYGGHTSYELTNGSWGQERPRFLKSVLETIDYFAPGFSDGVIDTQLLLPKDIEEQLNIPGGHINHGDMSLDQMFFMRPVPHYSDYRSPIRGLYQCGASTHPGGGVSGVPGHNAAREILKDLRKRRRAA